MTNPKQLLDAFEIVPKKSLGQNFLHDPTVLSQIVQNAQLPNGAVVLEIGAGTGALTTLLAQNAGRVVAIETDERLAPLLTQQLADYDNIELRWGDFLKMPIDLGDVYYVVANLPYYITSAVLRKLLEATPPPQRLVLTVQKEVAERMLAEPGQMSILSVSVQFYAQPRLVMKLNPAVFWPRPDVESAVVRLDVYEQFAVDVPDTKTFFRVVRAGFGQKRKQLKNSLAGGLGIKASAAQLLLQQADISPSRRAETLNLEEWAALARVYAAS